MNSNIQIGDKVIEELLKIDQVVSLLKKSDEEESKKIVKEYKL